MQQQAGVVMHLARSGRLILKASSQVRDGSILVDEAGRRVCKVIETIGPVSSPYLSSQPLTDRIERVVGKTLFISEDAGRPSGPRRERGRLFRGRERSKRPTPHHRER